MPELIVKHLDSFILIAAFMPDARDIRLEHEVCKRFLDRVLEHEPNTKLRISITALGEVLVEFLRRKIPEEASLRKLWEFVRKMGKRFEPYSPKLKGTASNIHEALGLIGHCCDDMESAQADASMLAYAMVDPAAITVYTVDRHLLLCRKVQEAVQQFREDHNLEKLRIKPIP